MRRITLWLSGGITGLALVVAGLFGFLNTAPGFRVIERYTPMFTDGEVSLFEVSGRFPDRLRIGRIVLSDPEGAWMNIEQLDLDWSPRHLLEGRAEIDQLSAVHSDMLRIPAYPEDPQSDNSLPVFFSFHHLSVARFDLWAPVAGTPMAFTLGGSGELIALDQGTADLSLQRLDEAGSYRIFGGIGPEGTQMAASISEPPQGLLAGLNGLPNLGAIAAEGSLNGPWNASRIQVRINAGALKASAQGVVDWVGESADLSVTLAAPAMSPRPDLAWQSMQVNARVNGPFTGPHATGTLQIDALKAADAAVRRIAAEVRGDADQVQVQAEGVGVSLPGPSPNLLGDHPLLLKATMNLKLPQRPVSFTLKHPLLTSEGTVSTAGSRRAELAVNLPALDPLAAAAGFHLQGDANLGLRATEQGSTTHLDLSGKLAVNTGQAPLPALIGSRGILRATAMLQGSELTQSKLQFDGKALSLIAEGRIGAQASDLKFQVGLPDLKALVDDLRGKLNIQGTLSGPMMHWGLDTALAGEVSAKGIPSGPFTAQLKAAGLPGAPSGTLTAHGSLDGSALAVSIAAAPATGSTADVKVEQLDWKSLHGTGLFSLRKEWPLPIGKFEARIGRLEDLQRLVGVPLTGSLTVNLDSVQRDQSIQSRVRFDGQDIGVEGTAAAETLTLLTTVNDPLTHPVYNGHLVLNKLRVGTLESQLQLEFAGPKDLLDARLQAATPRLVDAPARLTATATLDARRGELDLSSLHAAWKGEDLRLLRRAHIALNDTIAVNGLRLGLRQASLEIDGRISPDLELSAELRELPANLIALVVPNLPLEGKLKADAHLSGSPARPTGTVHFDLTGVQARSGNARALPPLNMTASALLDGNSAHVDGRLAAGTNANLGLLGDVSLNAGNALDLRAEGTLDLKLLDSLLMAQGRRTRGRIALNAGVRGTLAQPLITGGVQLTQGQFEDYAMGLRFSDMSASLQSEGDMIRVDRFEAHAGQGRIDARGSIGLLQPKLPIDLKLTARNARPLSSDRLTVTLDSNLILHGEANERLAAVGNLHIRRTEIRIPEHIPATIAVLDVREPGAPPPPPAKPGPDIGIDLTIDAADQIFVRGRGLDAEMAGKIHLLGTANNPQPNGRFAMRRGQYTLMGKTLTFSKGEVGFDGGTLTNPTLDFVANTTNSNITATLAVGGTARKPKIMLSSVPELPQDEVLAQLLFGRGSASLSPLELAQIAGALASLTGVTSGLYNPLETVRKGLGLDRLAMGSTKSGAPTLEAGRYVAPGVYLGAKQGFSGGSAIPQAAVQIDLTEGLKLEGTVGTGNNNASATSTGASSAGVIYQFEY